MDAKKKKILMIAGGGLLTVLLIYGIYKAVSKKKDDEDLGGGGSASSSSGGILNLKGFPLKRGSSGDNVKTLQRILNKSIRPPMAMLVVDGKFGPLTEAAAQQVLKTKSISKFLFDREKRKHPELIF